MNTQPLKFISFLTLAFLLILPQFSVAHAQTTPRPAQAGVTWYVATTGNDSNDCLTTSTPCLTIGGAIGKAGDGDVIKVAGGAYIAQSGGQAVTINKSIDLSGGWDSSFSTQDQTSIIDGNKSQRVFSVFSGTVIIERFTIQNGSVPDQGGGVYNQAVLTIKNSIIKNNRSLWQGGGIFNNGGTLIVENTAIVQNGAGTFGGSGGGGGAGIANFSGNVTVNYSTISNNYILGSFNGAAVDNFYNAIFTINNSSVYSNSGEISTGIINSVSASLFINNSTISSNNIGYSGAVTEQHSTVVIKNSTIANNHSSNYSGGISSCPAGGCAANFSIQNSIIAGNTAENGSPDCLGNITSLGNNIIGDGTNCNFSATNGDIVGQTNNPINAKVSPLPIQPGGYLVLLSGSPAINAGNSCLPIDQRGVSRPQEGTCDIGAYEYIDTSTSGPAAHFGMYDGSEQIQYIGKTFLTQLAVSVVDADGTPVSGVNVTFSTPISNASGTFSDTGTNTTTAMTNAYGVATASPLTANLINGDYQVKATVQGVADEVSFSLSNSNAVSIIIDQGSNQKGYLGRYFETPMSVYVKDILGNPLSGINVTLTAPLSGPSGIFADTSSTSTMITTDANGHASAGAFRANFQEGNYQVLLEVPNAANSTYFSLTNSQVSLSSNFLINGDFENTSSLGYGWTQYSSLFQTPLCTPERCGYGGGTAGPHSGNTWVWFGGAPSPYNENAYIRQYINTPGGPTYLRFYLWIGYAQNGGSINDKITVNFRSNQELIIDATKFWKYSNYKLVEVDLGNLAFGSYELIISGETQQKIVNFNIDDVFVNSALFGDVYPDQWYWSYVERLYGSGITGGCNSAPLTYCPTEPVTRAQMAVFLLKGIHGSSFAPPAIGASTGFTDVDITHWAAAWIKQLAAESITGGCGSGIYCPETTVTRAQMAVFLLKAMHGSSYSPPDVSATFGDTSGHWAEDWIEQLAVEGITSGCGNGNYCPENPVTRDQMAVFLVKAFNLP